MAVVRFGTKQAALRAREEAQTFTPGGALIGKAGRLLSPFEQRARALKGKRQIFPGILGQTPEQTRLERAMASETTGTLKRGFMNIRQHLASFGQADRQQAKAALKKRPRSKFRGKKGNRALDDEMKRKIFTIR